MSGPGDRASKTVTSVRAQAVGRVEGHGAGPTKVDLDLSLSPGSEGSARLHMSSAREPGDLARASLPMVADRRTRESEER